MSTEFREDLGDCWHVIVGEPAWDSPPGEMQWRSERYEPKVPPATLPQQVTVDPQALSDAQAKIAAATTVAGLRNAVQAALDLLNPGT